MCCFVDIILLRCHVGNQDFLTFSGVEGLIARVTLISGLMGASCIRAASLLGQKRE
jgi:hypothetical protein